MRSVSSSENKTISFLLTLLYIVITTTRKTLMHIKDSAIIVSKRILQENSAIINCFTKKHGIFAGVASNITAKKMHIYQLGNIVDFIWNARLEEHIGSAKCELLFSSYHLMQSKVKLYAVNSLFSMITASFQERIPHTEFFLLLEKYISSVDKKFSIMDYIFLESKILEESGYGLDLRKCAVTGRQDNLYYVSPKSARAVSLEAGLPYNNLLLKLPECAIRNEEPQNVQELEALFNLPLYFFQRYIFKSKVPEARKLFVQLLKDKLETSNIP